MSDSELVDFLRWALPRLHMRWPGFRKVRRQVGRRIGRRIRELELAGHAAYRDRLESDPGEWKELDGLCRITISRFWRDREVFATLRDRVIPRLAGRASGGELSCWSAGCASGEEPYSVAILWELALAQRFGDVTLRVLATDADRHMLERASRARYQPKTVRELERPWIEAAFEPDGDELCLRSSPRAAVEFRHHDVRDAPPGQGFDLILCRNLALTYFDEDLQRRVLAGLVEALVREGALVIGSHEKLPRGTWPLVREGRAIYRKVSE